MKFVKLQFTVDVVQDQDGRPSFTLRVATPTDQVTVFANAKMIEGWRVGDIARITSSSDLEIAP